MRVITGSARGRKLLSPEGLETRPTSDMAKGAIFNIVQNEVPGSVVLDLFSGSGQLGIEALSRGASYAVFVDNNTSAINIIKQNLNTTGLSENTKVTKMDAVSFLQATTHTFDIALLDPPYGVEILPKILPMLAGKMSGDGIIICETDRKTDLPQQVEGFLLHRTYNHGKAKLTVYRREECI